MKTCTACEGLKSARCTCCGTNFDADGYPYLPGFPMPKRELAQDPVVRWSEHNKPKEPTK